MISNDPSENVRQLGDVSAFNRDLFTYSGFDDRPFARASIVADESSKVT